MKDIMPRRDFLIKSGLAASGMAAAKAGFSIGKQDETVRIGIIGTGDRGTGLASEISAISDFRIVAGCDVLPFRLETFVSLVGTGVKTYTDYRKLLDNKEIDAVVIATPLYLHKQMVFDAADAGKHIYCEKTMAYNIEQTLQVVKKVRSMKTVFQVGHQYRCYPLYSTVLEKINNGVIGDIKHFICHYNRNNNWRRTVPDPALEKMINWRMYREYSGGVTAELSSHQIDVMNYLLGSHPRKISGTGSTNYWKDGRETFDNINLVMEYPGQIAGIVSCHLSNAHQPYVIKLLGTKGTIEILRENAFYYPEETALEMAQKQTGIVDGVSGATKHIEAGKRYPVAVDLKEGYDATTYALHHFGHCVKNNQVPASNIETGKVAAIAVDMANRAMEHERIEYWKPEYGG
jgi:predicted dehydrogenase